MPGSKLDAPLTFEPLFMERVWGGRKLAALYGKTLPPDVPIGESWEIVDRPEAQSVVRNGSFKGRTLHDLWRDHRAEVFGEVKETERFPLLIKLLDAREKLSIQVHPPASVATDLGGEAKSEFWYIAEAEPGAELYVGLKEGCARATLEEAIADGSVARHLHRIAVGSGDAMFLPSGRLHAIGAGIVLFEIQQNSDTTYRVFDWNRRDAAGQERDLHVEASLRSIDFEDCEPKLVQANGETLVRQTFFEVQKWLLENDRPAVEAGKFAIVGCLSGEIGCFNVSLKPGEFCLVPATLADRTLRPLAAATSLLRVTIPS